MIMEAEKFQDLQLASWWLKTVHGISSSRRAGKFPSCSIQVSSWLDEAHPP